MNARPLLALLLPAAIACASSTASSPDEPAACTALSACCQTIGDGNALHATCQAGLADGGGGCAAALEMVSAKGGCGDAGVSASRASTSRTSTSRASSGASASRASGNLPPGATLITPAGTLPAGAPDTCSGSEYYEGYPSGLCPSGPTYYLCVGGSFTYYDCSPPGAGWSPPR